jgi:hypothetical protein
MTETTVRRCIGCGQLINDGESYIVDGILLFHSGCFDDGDPE